MLFGLDLVPLFLSCFVYQLLNGGIFYFSESNKSLVFEISYLLLIFATSKVWNCGHNSCLATAELLNAARCTLRHLKTEYREMNDSRTEVIKARLTTDEKKRIMDLAKAEGVSLSTYLRRSLLREKIVSKTDIQTVFELKKIGNNLNQLAKHVNTLPVNENIIESISFIKNYIDELRNITDKLT